MQILVTTIIAFLPSILLGAWAGERIASMKWRAGLYGCPHRECAACNSIFHQSWHDPDHPDLCGQCQGAT